MFNVEVHKDKNYLVSKIGGFPDIDEVHELIKALTDGIRQLRPGFFMINDMTEMKPWSPEGVDEMKRFQAHLSQSPLKKVIRIVDSPIAKSQVNRVHKQVASYETVEVRSMEEALSIVEEES